jgi:hypothetical protein
MDIVKEYCKGKLRIEGSFITWEDLKLLPKNSHNKISNYWKMIQDKKKRLYKNGNV